MQALFHLMELFLV